MTKYTFYIGTNDKDTKRPIDTPEKMYTILKAFIYNNTEGATIREGRGVFTHDNGEKVEEFTYIVEIMGIDEKRARMLCESLKLIFNQESIMLTSQNIEVNFI